jgi:hypothetical protein
LHPLHVDLETDKQSLHGSESALSLVQPEMHHPDCQQYSFNMQLMFSLIAREKLNVIQMYAQLMVRTGPNGTNIDLQYQ